MHRFPKFGQQTPLFFMLHGIEMIILQCPSRVNLRRIYLLYTFLYTESLLNHSLLIDCTVVHSVFD